MSRYEYGKARKLHAQEERPTMQPVIIPALIAPPLPEPTEDQLADAYQESCEIESIAVELDWQDRQALPPR